MDRLVFVAVEEELIDIFFEIYWHSLVFSTFATLLLQEASARLTINSQLNLGEAISKKFEGKSSRTLVLFIIIVAIVLGCAAYEAGNILGAVEGLGMMFDIFYSLFVESPPFVCR